MMQRTRVIAEDSIAAMAKITRELGEDAVILSARQVSGGYEIIAEHEQRLPLPEPTRGKTPFEIAMAKQRKAEKFKAYMNDGIKPSPAPKISVIPTEQTQSPRIEPRVEAPVKAPAKPAAPDHRLMALEKSVNEIKSMLGSELLLSGLRASGASPALISIFLAQSGALDSQSSDRKFARFMAQRMMHKKPPTLTAGPRVIVTVGPSGSGKTTMLAQLAARVRMSLPDEKMTFVNADSSKMGASEQLRAYGRILDVPVVDLESPDELSNLARSAGRRISMFVDMPSNPDECSTLLNALQKNSNDMAPLIRCGVIASTISAESINLLLERYPMLDTLALTKLNESPMTLGALSKLCLAGPGVSFLSHSSHLVRGLTDPDIATLEHIIRGSLSGSLGETLN
jgi:flagellar biosynthesis protein FlhF